MVGDRAPSTISKPKVAESSSLPNKSLTQCDAVCERKLLLPGCDRITGARFSHAYRRQRRKAWHAVAHRASVAVTPCCDLLNLVEVLEFRLERAELVIRSSPCKVDNCVRTDVPRHVHSRHVCSIRTSAGACSWVMPMFDVRPERPDHRARAHVKLMFGGV